MIPVQNGNFGHDLFCENTLLKFVKFQVCSIISIIFHHMKQFVNILHIYKLRAIQPYIFHQYSVISETLRIELKEVHSKTMRLKSAIWNVSDSDLEKSDPIRFWNQLFSGIFVSDRHVSEPFFWNIADISEEGFHQSGIWNQTILVDFSYFNVKCDYSHQ